MSLLLAVFFGVAYSPALAQTLEEQIQAAKQQVNDLQQQILQRRITDQPSRDSSSAPRLATESRNQPMMTENLSLGDRGLVVARLQARLNQLLATPVATFGPGSPGQETSFFGPKTLAAVKRFQARYAAEVLAPVGLTRASGFVGPQTRTKLNNLLEGSFQSAPETAAGGSQPASNADNESDLKQPESRFAITKWSFTDDDKRRIAANFSDDFRRKYLPDYLNTASVQMQSGKNQLQREYQNRLEGGTSLKQVREKLLALDSFLEPSKLLRSSLDVIFGSSEPVLAQGIFVFGGRVTLVSPCPVPPGAFQVVVVGVRPGSFTYFPGLSQIRPIYSAIPHPPQSTLGSYAPGPTCFTPSLPPVPLTQGTIIQMGVSQI